MYEESGDREEAASFERGKETRTIIVDDGRKMFGLSVTFLGVLVES